MFPFSIFLGDNFIGEILRIFYKDANDNETSEKSSLILKIAPQNVLRRQKLRLRDLFLREIDMYDQVYMHLNDKRTQFLIKKISK